MFTKFIKFSEKRGLKETALEVELQNVAAKHKFCPVIHSVQWATDGCTISMDNLDAMCLADKYGDKESDLPPAIWAKIHKILSTLYEVEGIEYIDITPYNFIEKDGVIYIIDFGDAYYTKSEKTVNWFLRDFLDGCYGWNPDFK